MVAESFYILLYLCNLQSTDVAGLTNEPYIPDGEDAEDIPFLSVRLVAPTPRFISRFEGNNKSVCILEYVEERSKNEEEEQKATERMKKQKQRVADLREWNGSIVKLFSACVSTHIICWASRVAHSSSSISTISLPFSSQSKIVSSIDTLGKSIV